LAALTGPPHLSWVMCCLFAAVADFGARCLIVFGTVFLNEISNTESKSGMFFAVASLQVGMYCTRSGFVLDEPVRDQYEKLSYATPKTRILFPPPGTVL